MRKYFFIVVWLVCFRCCFCEKNVVPQVFAVNNTSTYALHLGIPYCSTTVKPKDDPWTVTFFISNENILLEKQRGQISSWHTAFFSVFPSMQLTSKAAGHNDEEDVCVEIPACSRTRINFGDSPRCVQVGVGYSYIVTNSSGHELFFFRHTLPALTSPVESVAVLWDENSNAIISWKSGLRYAREETVFEIGISFRCSGSPTCCEEKINTRKHLVQFNRKPIIVPFGDNFVLTGCFLLSDSNQIHCIHPNTKYDVTVTATDNYSYHSTDLVVVTPPAAPTAPPQVTLLQVGKTFATFSVTSATPLLASVISINITTRNLKTLEIINSSQIEHALFCNDMRVESVVTVFDLKACSSYEVEFAFNTKVGLSPFSQATSITTLSNPSVKLPAPVVYVFDRHPTNSTKMVNITWSLPEDHGINIVGVEIVSKNSSSQNFHVVGMEQNPSLLYFITSICCSCMNNLHIRLLVLSDHDEVVPGPLSDPAHLTSPTAVPCGSTEKSSFSTVSHSTSSASYLSLLVVVIVFSVIVLMMIVALSVYKKRKTGCGTKSSDHVWKINEEDLELGSVVSFGFFGATMKANLKNAENYEQNLKTSKLLVKSCTLAKDEPSFHAEMGIMKKLTRSKATNILALYGLCVGDGMLMAAYEDCEQGNLIDFLGAIENTSGCNNQTYRLCQLACGAARGMGFLSSAGIIVGAISCQHCFVDAKGSCKIGEIGKYEATAELNSYRSCGQRSNILRWLAPEPLQNDKFSRSSDVFSFGVFVWELFSLGLRPYPYLNDDEWILKVIQGYRMFKPSLCPDEIYELLENCWSCFTPTWGLITQEFDDCFNKLRFSDPSIKSSTESAPEIKIVSPEAKLFSMPKIEVTVVSDPEETIV